MENNKTVVPPRGGGAVGAGPATEQAPVAVAVRKYGVGMNSKKPERRYLYLQIKPFDGDDLETGMRNAINAINSILVVWNPPVRRGFFRRDMWWEHTRCIYCQRRMEYENKKWQAGEYVWRRNMCMRHWMVHHLSMVVPGEPAELLTNRPINITADTAGMLLSTETANYKYNVRVTKETAEMDVEYKGKTYKFTYRNHMRGFPYNSSYMNILLDVYTTLELFRDFLTDYVLKRRLHNNVVINDTFKIPPAQPDATECEPCRL
jgi:YHS domain-containing protein